MAIYFILGILALGVASYWIFRPNKPKSPLDDFYVSTQAQSNERVKNLGLDKTSEDASYILDATKLSFPHLEREREEIDYKADPETDWIIDLVPVNGEHFKKVDFTKMFDYEWRVNYDSTIYGYSPVDNRWTYANAGDSPDIYSELQVAVNVQRVYHHENPDFDPAKLERYLVELGKRIKKYPIELKIAPKETIADAILKAKMLVGIYNEFNAEAIVVLQNDKPYKGIEMWDALQSLGLTWGDGDLFHWYNPKEYGGDEYFSVWTTTAPGYFLPERVKAGNMNPENLIFGFSIPRSADPKNTFDLMLDAGKYCQKRLGGRLLNQYGQPLEEEKEKHYLAGLLEKMENSGIIAGSGTALKRF